MALDMVSGYTVSAWYAISSIIHACIHGLLPAGLLIAAAYFWITSHVLVSVEYTE